MAKASSSSRNAGIRVTRIGSRDLEVVRQFLAAPPSYPGITLHLGANHLYPQQEPSQTEFELWTRLYAFWSPRVVTLKLREESLGPPDSTHSNLRTHFYYHVERMSNLRNFSAPLFNLQDLRLIRNFIELHKRNIRLFIHLTIDGDSEFVQAINGNSFREGGDVHVEAFRDFAASVAASKSKFEVELRGKAVYPREICAALFKKVVGIQLLRVTHDLLPLYEVFPRLKNLDSVAVDPPVYTRQLVFPPSLETLGVDRGFPDPGLLPTSLSFLRIASFETDINNLLSSLTSLGNRCANLKTLHINWKFKPTMKPQQIHKFPPVRGLQNLRSLAFGGNIGSAGDVKVKASAILDVFPWDCVKLCYMAVCFSDSNSTFVPVVTEEVLKKICEGPSAKTLLKIGIRKESVTPEGLPYLRRLRSLASANWKQREENVGRGAWQLHSFPAFIERQLRGLEQL